MDEVRLHREADRQPPRRPLGRRDRSRHDSPAEGWCVPSFTAEFVIKVSYTNYFTAHQASGSSAGGSPNIIRSTAIVTREAAAKVQNNLPLQGRAKKFLHV